MTLPTAEQLNAYDMTPIMALFNPVPEVAFINEPAGVNHYRMLRWFGEQGRHWVCDIGTYMGFSMACLGLNGSIVFTYDTSFKHLHFKNPLQSGNRFELMGDTETFHPNIMFSSLILVDTWHEGKMEQDVYDYLVGVKWKGILIYDDIYYNDAMKAFWAGIEHQGKIDDTHIGHATGTGIIEFI